MLPPEIIPGYATDAELRPFSILCWDNAAAGGVAEMVIYAETAGILHNLTLSLLVLGPGVTMLNMGRWKHC